MTRDIIDRGFWEVGFDTLVRSALDFEGKASRLEGLSGLACYLLAGILVYLFVGWAVNSVSGSFLILLVLLVWIVVALLHLGAVSLCVRRLRHLGRLHKVLLVVRFIPTALILLLFTLSVLMDDGIWDRAWGAWTGLGTLLLLLVSMVLVIEAILNILCLILLSFCSDRSAMERP